MNQFEINEINKKIIVNTSNLGLVIDVFPT